MREMISVNETKTFQYYLSKYFTAYLGAERNVSTHTIASYADTFKLFLNYFENILKKRTDKIRLDDITKENITDFLNWLEMIVMQPSHQETFDQLRYIRLSDMFKQKILSMSMNTEKY